MIIADDFIGLAVFCACVVEMLVSATVALGATLVLNRAFSRYFNRREGTGTNPLDYYCIKRNKNKLG